MDVFGCCVRVCVVRCGVLCCDACMICDSCSLFVCFGLYCFGVRRCSVVLLWFVFRCVVVCCCDCFVCCVSVCWLWCGYVDLLFRGFVVGVIVFGWCCVCIGVCWLRLFMLCPVLLGMLCLVWLGLVCVELFWFGLFWCVLWFCCFVLLRWLRYVALSCLRLLVVCYVCVWVWCVVVVVACLLVWRVV